MTRWMRRLAGATLAAAALLAAAPAGALSLFLSPATVSPAPGDSFALDLIVSGLGDHAPPSLGAFDVTLSFDPGAVAFSSVSFDEFLGQIPSEATAGYVVGAGTLELAEYSILLPPALDVLQPATFRLATLYFTATSAAPSTIAITSALLGDGDGLPLALSSPPGAANVTPVPEPAAALVFALGIAVAMRAPRRSARGQAAGARTSALTSATGRSIHSSSRCEA